jgi:hypothetical protein
MLDNVMLDTRRTQENTYLRCRIRQRHYIVERTLTVKMEVMFCYLSNVTVPIAGVNVWIEI